jgi:hypothetical protein
MGWWGEAPEGNSLRDPMNVSNPLDREPRLPETTSAVESWVLERTTVGVVGDEAGYYDDVTEESRLRQSAGVRWR